MSTLEMVTVTTNVIAAVACSIMLRRTIRDVRIVNQELAEHNATVHKGEEK